jgi:hypothetical protein
MGGREMESKEKSIIHLKNLEKTEEHTKKCYSAPMLTVYGGLKEITGSIARGNKHDNIYPQGPSD